MQTAERERAGGLSHREGDHAAAGVDLRDAEAHQFAADFGALAACHDHARIRHTEPQDRDEALELIVRHQAIRVERNAAGWLQTREADRMRADAARLLQVQRVGDEPQHIEAPVESLILIPPNTRRRASISVVRDASGITAGFMARLMGDETLGRMVIGEFLEDIPRQMDALRSFLAASDTTSAHRQAHSIKGASANVGGEALRVVARDAEAAGQAGDLDAIIALVPDLEMQFARLRGAILEFAGPDGLRAGELD